MTDCRQNSENQRRQVCYRINKLKSSCENLTKFKDDLSNRLCELNKVVDRLIDEKRARKYDPHLKIDLTSYNISTQSLKPSSIHHEQQPTSTTTTTDLIDHYDILSSHHNKNFYNNSASEAFKTKLSLCLRELAPKADEVVDLGEQLCHSNFDT